MKYEEIISSAEQNFQNWDEETHGPKMDAEVNRNNVVSFYNMDKQGDDRIVWAGDNGLDQYHSFNSLAVEAASYFCISKERALDTLHKMGAEQLDPESAIAGFRDYPIDRTRKELENVLNSMTKDDISAALSEGRLEISSSQYNVTEHKDTGKYHVTFTEDYMKQLHHICDVQGMEDKLDEMVAGGFQMTSVSSEYMDYNGSLSQKGSIPQVNVYIFQNDEGQIEKLISDNGNFVEYSYDDAKARDSMFREEASPKIKEAFTFAEKTGFDQSVCIRLFHEIDDISNMDMDTFAEQYKQAVEGSLKNIASSNLWDRYRGAEGPDQEGQPRERNLKEMLSATAIKKEEAIKEMLGTQSPVFQAFGKNAFHDAGKTNTITNLNMILIGQELDKHLDSIDSYRELVSSLPYENIELVTQMTGREEKVMSLIAEQGTPEDMKKYLTQTIPSDRIPEEELQTENTYFYRTCSDHTVSAVWQEANAMTLDGSADFKGCDRKSIMSVMGGIEHDSQLTSEQKDILGRAYLQAQFSGNKDNQYLNHLLHMNVDQKFERSMDMVFSDLKDQVSLMKEILSEKYHQIIDSVMNNHQVKDAASYMKEMGDRLKEENLPGRVRYIITGQQIGQEGQAAPKTEMRFRFKNMGDLSIPLKDEISSHFQEWVEEAKEKAKEWMDAITSDRDAQKDGIHETSADGTMHADSQKRVYIDSPERVIIEIDTVTVEEGSNKTRVKMSPEQVLSFNAGRLGQEIAEGLKENDQYVTAFFREKGSVYTAVPAVKEGPDNSEHDVTGIVLVTTVQNEAGESETWIMADTYQDIESMKDLSRQHRMNEIERTLPDTVLELSFVEMGDADSMKITERFVAINENGEAVPQNYETVLDLEKGTIRVSAEGDSHAADIGESLKLENLRSQQAVSDEQLLSMDGKSGEQIFDLIDAIGMESISAKTVAEVLQESFGDEMYEKSAVVQLVDEMDEYAQANGFGEDVMHDLIKDYGQSSPERKGHEEEPDIDREEPEIDEEEPEFDDHDEFDIG